MVRDWEGIVWEQSGNSEGLGGDSEGTVRDWEGIEREQ